MPHNQEQSALCGGALSVVNTCGKLLERRTRNKAAERKEKSVKEEPITMLIRHCKRLHLLNQPPKIKRVCHNNILRRTLYE